MLNSILIVKTHGTYGLHSINRNTFNMKYYDTIQYPRSFRNIVVTALRINNIILNVLGYISATKIVSGCVRMAIGAAIIITTLRIGDRNANEGAIIGRWYDEAVQLGLAQIARGALEAFIPYGRLVNATLDILGTPANLLSTIPACPGCRARGAGNHMHPHHEVDYPLAFVPLYLA